MPFLKSKDTKTLDKLYLELSQFIRARTERELRYEELIMAVGNKYPNETRHETALRYIRQAETQDDAPCEQEDIK